MPPVSRSALLAALPPESNLAPRPAAAKIVVLDDDPTGAPAPKANGPASPTSSSPAMQADPTPWPA